MRHFLDFIGCSLRVAKQSKNPFGVVAIGVKLSVSTKTMMMLSRTFRPAARHLCIRSALLSSSSLPLVATSFNEETKVATLSMNRPPVNSLSLEL